MAKKSDTKAVAKTKSKPLKATKPPKAVDISTVGGFSSKFPMGTHTTHDVSLADYSREALTTYGSYVVEDRAVPDFRDGLKPVHRAVLWSIAGLGLRPHVGYKKSARAVGEAIGKYHPHGDAACYGAMVTITNTTPPFVAGQGGFGAPDTPASAMRYTEARMSKFTDMFLMDSEYLNVVPYEPNFSNDEKIPLYLPALLPSLFFITSIPAPAYGVRAGHPAFSMGTISKVVIDMLNGKEYTAKKLASTLKINHPFGCIDISKDSDIEEMMASGKGSVAYAPLVHTDEAKRVIYVRSYVPNTLAATESIDRTLAKISNLEGVRSALNTQGKKFKHSGPFGALFTITCQKNLTDEQFDEICHKVDLLVKSSVSYRLGITIRRSGEKANEFKYLDYVAYFKAWVRYRVKLEERLIEYKLEKLLRLLHINEVYLFAVNNLPKLLKALPKALAAKDPADVLAKALKMPLDDANIILDRKVRQLAKLEAGALEQKIKELKAEIKQLKADQKEPGARAARDTADRVKRYLKNPDKTMSGLPVE